MQLRNTIGGSSNALGWLIDTRAHGGYVVAAGSTVDGRPYQITHYTDPGPLPEWLAQRLTPRPVPPAGPVTVELGPGRRAAYLAAAVERQVDQVTTAPEGNATTPCTCLRSRWGNSSPEANSTGRSLPAC